MTELLPCPFCGGRMQFRKALWPSEGDTDAVIHAEPTVCGLTDFSLGNWDETVLAAWNRRATPEAPSDAWQPIETAPKDGTWILGWAQSDSTPYRVSWGRNHNGSMTWCTSSFSFVGGYITHWMPLPAPPLRPDGQTGGK
jgi:hypothetical protein